MKLYGLIGYPLSHSFSKKYFNEKFKTEGKSVEMYENFPMDDLGKLNQLITDNPDLVGLNVTIPYKEKVIAYLHEVNNVAKEIEAVNTIKIIRTNQQVFLSGYNTDVYGFRESLLPHLKKNHKKALILGTGGASKAIKHVLSSLNIDYLSVSRNRLNEKTIGYQEINKNIMHEHNLIINTTPLGTYPETEQYPEIPYQHLTSEHLLYDLVYNPPVTRFLEKGENKGATIVNGLEMLHLQAEKSYEIWNSND